MRLDPLSSMLFALADPTRRGLLARLATGDATVTDLAMPYDMSVAAISKHLKGLENAGLISRGRDAQGRPCPPEAAPLRSLSEWPQKYRPARAANSPHPQSQLSPQAKHPSTRDPHDN